MTQSTWALVMAVAAVILVLGFVLLYKYSLQFKGWINTTDNSG